MYGRLRLINQHLNSSVARFRANRAKSYNIYIYKTCIASSLWSIPFLITKPELLSQGSSLSS